MKRSWSSPSSLCPLSGSAPKKLRRLAFVPSHSMPFLPGRSHPRSSQWQCWTLIPFSISMLTYQYWCWSSLTDGRNEHQEAGSAHLSREKVQAQPKLDDAGPRIVTLRQNCCNAIHISTHQGDSRFFSC